MSNIAAIVVPVYKETLSDSEYLSLRHLHYYLGEYKTYFIAPKRISINYPGIEIKYFSNEYFANTRTYNKLLLTKKFYESFKDYQYILIYQLDCLVFSNELMYWCNQGYDYIGPPWVKTPELHWLKKTMVGNGGFSLRKINSFLSVLDSTKHWYDPDIYWEKISTQYNGVLRYIRYPKKLLLTIYRYNNITLHIEEFLKKNQNEDIFFSVYGNYYYPDFKIAPIKTALRFGFEADPRLCFKMNNNQLPFGCHAWERYDRSFWEPYLLTHHI